MSFEGWSICFSRGSCPLKVGQFVSGGVCLLTFGQFVSGGVCPLTAFQFVSGGGGGGRVL